MLAQFRQVVTGSSNVGIEYLERKHRFRNDCSPFICCMLYVQINGTKNSSIEVRPPQLQEQVARLAVYVGTGVGRCASLCRLLCATFEARVVTRVCCETSTAGQLMLDIVQLQQQDRVGTTDTMWSECTFAV